MPNIHPPGNKVQIKLEGRGISGTENMEDQVEDTVDVKWEIKNEEIHIKEEKSVTDEEHRYSYIS